MKDEPTPDDNQWLREKLKADKEHRRKTLKEAKKKARQSGKEAFSFAKLCRFYDPISDLAAPGAKPLLCALPGDHVDRGICFASGNDGSL
jgi:hypothetical protein